MKLRNKYAELSHLTNEASVETFFIIPLLRDLGFSNTQILAKTSLKELSVGSFKSRKKEQYRPDYALKLQRKVRCIIEVKSPKERLDDHVQQPRDYAMTLNGESETSKPVKYFVLTNGALTRVYKHDLNQPVIELGFGDFFDGNRRFEKFKEYLDKSHLSLEEATSLVANNFKLRKAPIQEVNAAFAWCHQHIYRSDNISQGAAFSEFVKLIALKLTSDRDILEKYRDRILEDEIVVPIDDVKFAEHWLMAREKDTPNPMDSIWFQDFIKKMELEIKQKRRKRIFDKDDHINLSPETIRGVVKKLQDIFLFGIDADLNGRLFETFLNATMRGKDLGQYFTPRSIVKLGVGLARLRVDPNDIRGGPIHTDRVIDACCGTGGFLIDALAEMWKQIDENRSLSDSEKAMLRDRIANHHIFGIDVGRDPNLSRIARLNMYLHGDGGSSIFNADSLDKELPVAPHDAADTVTEKEELKAIYAANGEGYFQAAITNPPFAKAYKIDVRDDERSTVTRILKQYAIRTWPDGKQKASLRSSVMYFERYHDLLVTGGRLVSVIDDGLLSGSENAHFRDFLRDRFIVRAVVSLPGDAFQRSKARVKTSLIVLTKKAYKEEPQPDVFMYPCRYVGTDDPSRQRTLPIDAKLRDLARNEIAAVLAEYDRFCNGKPLKKYVVAAKAISDRLDVKHCLMTPGERVPLWRRKGLNVVRLSEIVEPKMFSEEETLVSSDYEGTVTYLRVRYDGIAEIGDEVDPGETTYSYMWRVKEGDIVISNIAASYGSVAVVDRVTSGCVVTNEYTVLRAKRGYDPLTIWAILRSKEARADMLLVATGANRTRIKWEAISGLELPYPQIRQAKQFAKKIRQLNQKEETLKKEREAAISLLANRLNLDSEDAQKTLQAFKPPK